MNSVIKACASQKQWRRLEPKESEHLQIYSRGDFTKEQLNKRCVTEAIFGSYTTEQADYKPVVDKLVGAKIDVLYVGGYQGDIGIILRQAKKNIPHLNFVSGDTKVSVEFRIIAGEAAEGAYFTYGTDIRVLCESRNNSK